MKVSEKILILSWIYINRKYKVRKKNMRAKIGVTYRKEDVRKLFDYVQGKYNVNL